MSVRPGIFTGIQDRLRALPHPVVVVFSMYVGFSLMFGLLIPAAIIRSYGIDPVPQDFYPLPARGGDFAWTYAATNRLLRGEPIYVTSAPEGAPADPYLLLYSYPPTHVYALAPLGLLPFDVSYLVWSWLTIALIVASCLLAARMTEAPLLAFVSLLLIYGQSSFLQFQLERGQTDAPTLFFMVAMVSAYAGRRRNRYVAALCFVLAASFKTLPMAFGLFFLLRREFRLLIAAAAIGIGVVVLTGVSNWITWGTKIAPVYSQFFLGYNSDHSLYYLFEGLTRDFRSGLTLARAAATVLVATYAEMVLFNRQRQRMLLIELAIFVTIIDIATPWSANYKLVVLLFLFLSPFAILQIPFVRRRPLRFVTPLFVAFVLIVPWYGEYVTRLPFSVFAALAPVRIIIDNPLNPFISDRKVIVGLVACLLYLIALYLANAFPLGRVFGTWLRRLRARASSLRLPPLRPALAIGGLGLAIVATGAIALGYQREQASTAALIASFGPEVPINNSVSVSGYQVRYDSATHYTLTFVYHVHAPIHENLQAYFHAKAADDTIGLAMVGKPFFPSVITSFWPTDKYIVASVDATFAPMPYVLSVGFYDLSNARPYGEANLGEVAFPVS